ncbi:hypothetical protein ACVWZ6_001528 [Bradyrhizobium sp. GM6.1]
MAMEWTIGRKVRQREQAWAQASAVLLACSLALVCWLSPAWVRSSRRDGSRRPRSVPFAGGATGGVVGALTQAGVSDEEAPLYAEGVRRGGTLVSARVPDADRARYEAILNQSAVNLRDRSAAWQKAGWKNYDPSAQPYGAEEVRRERQLYGTGVR